MRSNALACLATAALTFCATRIQQLAATSAKTTVDEAKLAEIMSHLSLVELDDGAGGKVTTLRISGVNVQIVDGSGTTLAPSPHTGAGNLILGYNETGNPKGDMRTGTHNLVVGSRLSYTGSACLVSGDANVAHGPYSVAIGGTDNVARGTASCAIGGQGNEAYGSWSVAVGGGSNKASGSWSVTVAGENNLASGSWSSTVAGDENRATGSASAVIGQTGAVATQSWEVPPLR